MLPFASHQNLSAESSVDYFPSASEFADATSLAVASPAAASPASLAAASHPAAASASVPVAFASLPATPPAFRIRPVPEEHSRLNCLAREVPCHGALTVGISASCYSPPASILPPL